MDYTFIIGLAFILALGACYFLFVHPNKSALLIIDMQNDFCPGGSLGVTDGNTIVPIINQWIARFRNEKKLIIYSRDWHPEKTNHFKSPENPQGWEVHCVANTPGAAFHKDLVITNPNNILSKGMEKDVDAYSAFDNGARIQAVNLHRFLKINRIKKLYVCGLATDFCVKKTVMDGIGYGYEVYLITNAMKGVNLHPGDHKKAIADMVACGAFVYTGN